MVGSRQTVSNILLNTRWLQTNLGGIETGELKMLLKQARDITSGGDEVHVSSCPKLERFKEQLIEELTSQSYLKVMQRPPVKVGDWQWKAQSGLCLSTSRGGQVWDPGIWTLSQSLFLKPVEQGAAGHDCPSSLSAMTSWARLPHK